MPLLAINALMTINYVSTGTKDDSPSLQKRPTRAKRDPGSRARGFFPKQSVLRPEELQQLGRSESIRRWGGA